MSTSFTAPFVGLFFVLLPTVLVECNMINLWKGQFVYHEFNNERSLKDAEKYCSELGGRLPSVHSEQDVHDLENFAHLGTFLWLGAKGQNNTRRSIKYKWDDGSDFDYANWAESHPNCNTGCCGVGVKKFLRSRNSYPEMIDAPCDQEGLALCVLPILTPEAARDWIKRQISLHLTPSLDSASLMLLEQNVSINVLNESMNSLQETIKPLREQLEADQNAIKKLRATASQKDSSYSSLSGRVNICLALIILMILFFVTLNLYKLKVFSSAWPNRPSGRWSLVRIEPSECSA